MSWSRSRTHYRQTRWRPEMEPLEGRCLLTAPSSPVYSAVFDDAMTLDNAFTGADGNRYWTIDAGADNYQNDLYERPTAQTYQVRRASDGTRQFAAAEYFQNLDIVQARAGFDAQYLYVAIDLAGLARSTDDGQDTSEGLVYRYGFRLGLEADGGHSFLIVVDQPKLKNNPSTVFGQLGASGYRDVNGDVGGTGLSVTKQDLQSEVGGNGYETQVIADGRLAGGASVLWVRLDPTDPSIVEFALDYQALGFTADQLAELPYFEFEANKGLQGPSSYLWNDEYTESEAGSPYRATSGDRSKSEFGTQGLGNIYELDTLRGGALVPLSSLSGFVYVDLDNDDFRDANEHGIEGVLITLRGEDERGESVEITVATNAQGFYAFTGLRPGTYGLSEQQPSGYDDAGESLGSLGGQVGEDEFFGIVLGTGLDGVEYNFGERPSIGS